MDMDWFIVLLTLLYGYGALRESSGRLELTSRAEEIARDDHFLKTGA